MIQKHFSNIFIEISMLVFIAYALLFIPYTYYWTTSINAVYSYLFIAGAVVLYTIYRVIKNGDRYKILLLDIALYASGAVAILSCLFSGFMESSEQLKIYILSCSLYFLVRLSNVRSAQVLLVGLFVAFIAELAVGIKQAAPHEWLSSNFAISMKGTLENSGQYSCFMMLAGGLLFFQAQKLKQPLLRHGLSVFIFLVILFVVMLTKSRACLLAVIICGSYSARFHLHRWVRRFLDPVKARAFMITSLAVCFLTLLILLFFFKQNSSLGRLLVWKVSFHHSLDNPLTGIGYGRFPMEYGKWQAGYFAAHDASDRFRGVADMNYEMFNEPLQVFVETGIIGWLVFLFVLYSCFLLKPSFEFKQEFESYRMMLLAAFIFSLFSYPFHSTPNLLLIFICLALFANTAVQNEQPAAGSKRSMISSALMIYPLLLVLVTFGMVKHIGSYRAWAELRRIGSDVSRNNIPEYEQIYPYLASNGIFMNEFAKALFNSENYERSIQIMDLSRQYYICEDTYEITALASQEIKRYDRAEEALIFLTHLIPSKFRYRYLLAKLYIDKGDIDKAKEMAQEILNAPVKISSDEVENIRYEAKKIIEMKH